MEAKIDSLFQKAEQALERWFTSLEAHPVSTGLKTLLLLYMLRWIKRHIL